MLVPIPITRLGLHFGIYLPSGGSSDRDGCREETTQHHDVRAYILMVGWLF